MADLSHLRLDPVSDVPLYRQLADSIAHRIHSGVLRGGERLPPTRELAAQLGLNRTTVSAAYALLDEAKLVEGHVGRGSFVAGPASTHNHVISPAASRDWDAILPPLEAAPRAGPQQSSGQKPQISFASSRPADDQFPLEEFRRLSKEVIDSPEAREILQLGPAQGYAPLRRYLLEQAIATGVATSGDDVLITNGCQQGLDLLARVFATPSVPVIVEDPVYHGVVRVFSRSGAELLPIPVDDFGIDTAALEQVLHRRRPRYLVVTPSFQNPTGTTLPLQRRRRIVELVQHFGCVLIENDIYSELRYVGTALPTLKELDESGSTILLRSYSKVSFPGLRVGWVIAPRPVIARLAEAKEISDLHSDQLSQAVLLRFAESGELMRHLERTRRSGAERLASVLGACSRWLPHGSKYTHPEGGMNLWIEVPPPLTAEGVLNRAQESGVTFVPGKYFSARHAHQRALRISFGGLSAQQIERGIQILGEAARQELSAAVSNADFEPAAALV